MGDAADLPVSRDVSGTAGYSGTPLVRKLGIVDGTSVAVLEGPAGLTAHLGELPDGVTLRSGLRGQLDVVLLFVVEAARLRHRLPAAKKATFPDGMVWVAWPKQAAKLPTDITEDTVREVAFPLGMVDTKVCAISDIWSALRVVTRRELRG